MTPALDTLQVGCKETPESLGWAELRLVYRQHRALKGGSWAAFLHCLRLLASPGPAGRSCTRRRVPHQESCFPWRVGGAQRAGDRGGVGLRLVVRNRPRPWEEEPGP